MRKVIFIVVLMLFISGCTVPESDINTKAEELPNIQEKENFIDNETLSYISESIEQAVNIYDCSIYVDDENGKVKVTLFMESGAIGWVFADCIYSVTEAARESIEFCNKSLEDITVSFTINMPGKKDEFFRWKSADYVNGTLIDTTNKYINNITIEELFEKYDYQPIENDLQRE